MAWYGGVFRRWAYEILRVPATRKIPPKQGTWKRLAFADDIFQPTTPGTAQSGHINITGTVLVGDRLGVGNTAPDEKVHVTGIIEVEAGGIDATLADVLLINAAGYPGAGYVRNRVRSSASSTRGANLLVLETSTGVAGVWNANQLVLSGSGAVSLGAANAAAGAGDFTAAKLFFSDFVFSGDELHFKDAENGEATGYLNYYGYGKTAGQFRNLIIADGKGGTIAYFAAATKNINTGGQLAIGGNSFHLDNGNSGDSDTWINYYGYNGGLTKFRSLHVADGKGGDIALFAGSTKAVTFYGTVTLDGGLVTYGANDSAGAGYRLARVPNV